MGRVYSPRRASPLDPTRCGVIGCLSPFKVIPITRILLAWIGPAGREYLYIPQSIKGHSLLRIGSYSTGTAWNPTAAMMSIEIQTLG
jgi:hypothetical protein